jgi:uncharacterized protein involved in exopolysaccharide biosynthesis
MQNTSIELASGQPVRGLAEGFFRHWKMFMVLFFTVVILVAAYTFTAKKQYRSEMKFLLENNRSNAVITPDRNAANVVSEITEQQINSELEILASEDVIGAIADPGWTALPAAKRTPEALELHEKNLSEFRKRLKIEPARKSNVIAVSFTAPSAEEATETLDRYSSSYLAHRKLLSRPSGTSKFFAEEAHRYEKAWQHANGQLVEFQRQNHIVSVAQTEDALSKAILGYEDDLRTSHASLSELNGRLNASGNAVGNVPERMQTQLRTTAHQTSADQLRTLLAGLQNRRTELLTRYMPTDRLVVEVDRQIADTSESLNQEIAQKGSEETTDVNPTWQQVKGSLVEGQIEREAIQAKSSSLARSISGLRRQLSELQALDVPFNGLQETADQARSNFELFSEKRDQAQIEDLMDERKLVNIAIAESPTSTFKPSSPKPLLNGALGVLTAIFLAAGAVYFAESSRNTIANAPELEAISRFPVLATVAQGVPIAGKRQAGLDSPAFARSTRDPQHPGGLIPAMQNLRNANEA